MAAALRGRSFPRADGLALRRAVRVPRGRKTDPTADCAGAGVIAAFGAAEEAGLPLVDCYRAGVDAWLGAHPDQRREHAAPKAVAVLAAKVTLRIDGATGSR